MNSPVVSGTRVDSDSDGGDRLLVRWSTILLVLVALVVLLVIYVVLDNAVFNPV